MARSAPLAELFSDSIALTEKPPAVYAILNRSNGKLYIGSSSNPQSRKRGHVYDIKRGIHRSRFLMDDAWKCPTDFEFLIIEEVLDESKLLDREQFWINFYKASNPLFGYNRNPNAKSSSGLKWTKRQRLLKSIARSGIPQKHLRKPIVKMDMDFNIIEEYESLTAASLSMGFSKVSGTISGAVNRPNRSAYGFKWKYVTPA